MRKVLIVLSILGLSAATIAAPAKPSIPATTIDRITAQLYYNYSGTLSENVAPPSKAILWNSIIAEGDAIEPADDMLVTVFLNSKAGLGNFSPLKIVAKNAKGKILGQRIAEPTLTNKDGNAAAGLMLYDVGCAGKMTITATMGKLSKSTVLNLDCGE